MIEIQNQVRDDCPTKSLQGLPKQSFRNYTERLLRQPKKAISQWREKHYSSSISSPKLSAKVCIPASMATSVALLCEYFNSCW